MNLTGTEVRVGMTAAANVSSVNTTGSVTIGTPVAALVYTDAPTVAYSLRMDIANGETLALDMSTGAVTGTDPGVLQVETATASGAATSDGNVTVVVTSAILNATQTIQVPIVSGDSPLIWAPKILSALSANSSITEKYTPSIFGLNIKLTAKELAANDSTLNISMTNGVPSPGITEAPTSANTTAGKIATQAYRISGATWDQTDFEGQTLPTMTKAHALFIQSLDSNVDRVVFTSPTSSEITKLDPGSSALHFSKTGSLAFGAGDVEFLADGGDVFLTIDIHAG